MSARTATESTIAGLHVAQWRGPGPTVLALPGLTSTHRVWRHIAAELDDRHVVAPDLRGRGGSCRVGGPFGLTRHAQDLAAVADALDLRDVVIVGHSMGAFLAPVAARALGDRVGRLVLIDGGVPPQRPWWMRRAVVRTMFGAAARQMGKEWSGPQAYADAILMKSIAARPELREDIVDWCADELADGPRPRLARDAIVNDAVDTFFGADVVPALHALTVPAHLLAATAGKNDRAKPFYSEAVLEAWRGRVPKLTTERVTANHVTILFTPEALKALKG